MRTVIRTVFDQSRAFHEVEAYIQKHGFPVELRASVASSKRMAQLGGMFGVWVKEIAEYEGESEKVVHERLKDWFLARIYISNPIGPEQEQWVELLAHYQETGQQEKLERHAKRISLSWARVHQMSDYMDAIWKHYTAEGCYLSPLEKDR